MAFKILSRKSKLAGTVEDISHRGSPLDFQLILLGVPHTLPLTYIFERNHRSSIAPIAPIAPIALHSYFQYRSTRSFHFSEQKSGISVPTIERTALDSACPKARKTNLCRHLSIFRQRRPMALAPTPAPTRARVDEVAIVGREPLCDR
jgi:hypothetical protein